MSAALMDFYLNSHGIIYTPCPLCPSHLVLIFSPIIMFLLEKTHILSLRTASICYLLSLASVCERKPVCYVNACI